MRTIWEIREIDGDWDYPRALTEAWETLERSSSFCVREAVRLALTFYQRPDTEELTNAHVQSVSYLV